MNQVTFFNNPVMDLSSFNFFNNNKRQHSFFASKFDSFETFYDEEQESPNTGIYSFVVNQDPISNDILYDIYSFDQCIALIGGYAGIILFVTTFVMNAYQEFAYERSLMRVLYKSKIKGEVHDD
jgi:hypothetical protein